MDLKKYRSSQLEVMRKEDLMKLVPDINGTALDVGARDGFFSEILSKRFIVTAIDLEKPSTECHRVECLQGDVTKLNFKDNFFDFVFCAEVLEHISPQFLDNACYELQRVCKEYLLIGVPYKQDLRIGRTTCFSCGGKSPPWGHVNSFDENRIQKLFPHLKVEKTSFVGEVREATNSFSTLLMDLAGNPYGTYEQDESCVHCGAKLKPPPGRNILKKFCTKAACYTKYLSKQVVHSNWIHVLFKKTFL